MPLIAFINAVTGVERLGSIDGGNAAVGARSGKESKSVTLNRYALPHTAFFPKPPVKASV